MGYPVSNNTSIEYAGGAFQGVPTCGGDVSRWVCSDRIHAVYLRPDETGPYQRHGENETGPRIPLREPASVLGLDASLLADHSTRVRHEAAARGFL
jgi:hypothetical protein